jgi:hypothetical protein
MTKDDIIRMAREAGLFTHKEVQPELERFANLVAAAEREAAEERVTDLFADMETPYLPDIIAAIRARGTTWPFPTQLPPNRPIQPMPFNPENFEDAPL